MLYSRQVRAVLTLAVLLVASAFALGAGLTAQPPSLPSGGHSHFTTFAAPAISTSSQTTCTSKSTVTSASLGTVAAGSTVLVFVSIKQPSAITVSSVGAETGATWIPSSVFTKAGAVTNSGNVREEVWYRSSEAGGATFHTVVNISGTTNFCVTSVIITGANTGGAIDVVGSGTTGSNATAGDQQTTLLANDLVFGGVGIATTSTSETLTQISSWAILQSNMATSGLGMGTLDESFSSAQKVNPSVTISTSLQWAALSVSVGQVTAPTSAPSTPTLTSVTSSHVILGWTNPASLPTAEISNNTVFWGTSCGSSTWASWTNHQSTAGAANSATVSGLTFGTSYCFAVSVWNATGDSPISGTLTTSTLPHTVTSVSVSSVTSSGLTVSWTNSAGAVTNASVATTTTACTGSWTYVSLGSAGTSQAISGLSGATTYCIAVADYTAGGGGPPAFTNQTTLPSAPTALSVTGQTASSVSIGWTNPSGTLVNSTVYRWTGAACSGTVSATNIGSVATSSSQTGLAGATEYAFEVQAWGSQGASSTSSCVDGTTLPGAPSSLSVSQITSSGLEVSWTLPTGTIANASIFYGSSCASLGTHTSLGAVSSATLTGLSPATTYCSEIQAWSSSGNGAPAFTNGTTLPGTPTGLAATPSTTSVYISWTNSPGSLVNVTAVYGQTCGTWNLRISLGVVSSATVAGLAAAVTYCFAVYDWSSSGSGGLVFVNATTGTALPPAPTGLVVASVTTTSVTLSWLNPTTTTIVSTKVLWGLRCDAQAWTAVFGPVNSGAVSGLSQSTTYCFSVVVYNANGGSNASSPVTGTTAGPGGGGGGSSDGGTSGQPATNESVPGVPSGVVMALALSIRVIAVGVAALGVALAVVANRPVYRWTGGVLFVVALVVVLI